jgi:hypothetical protein
MTDEIETVVSRTGEAGVVEGSRIAVGTAIAMAAAETETTALPVAGQAALADGKEAASAIGAATTETAMTTETGVADMAVEAEEAGFQTVVTAEGTDTTIAVGAVLKTAMTAAGVAASTTDEVGVLRTGEEGTTTGEEEVAGSRTGTEVVVAALTGMIVAAGASETMTTGVAVDSGTTTIAEEVDLARGDTTTDAMMIDVSIEILSERCNIVLHIWFYGPWTLSSFIRETQ